MAATRSSMSPQLASAASFSAVSPSKNVSYRNDTGFPMWMRSLAVFSSPSSAISFSSYSFSPGRRPMYSMRTAASTPGNPTTGISDIDAIADIAHKAGALLSVDATFAGPICIRPLSHGADLEIHSMTKYINGHGDSLGGCVLGRTALIDQIKELAMVNYGGILSPFNAWLVARGLSTVPLRMKQHSAVAMKVAEFLESCPATRFVWYPGLKSHPQHERAEKLMHGEYSGMISFDLKGDEKQHEKFLDALKLVTHAVSLGDIETLIVYYDRNSDKLPHYPAVYQEGFFRFSIGLEDAEDIIADLTQAMQAAGML